MHAAARKVASVAAADSKPGEECDFILDLCAKRKPWDGPQVLCHQPLGQCHVPVENGGIPTPHSSGDHDCSLPGVLISSAPLWTHLLR